MIIFGNICDRDSIFFLDVAEKIKKINHSEEVVFISFYEPANRKIQKKGFKVYNIYKYLESSKEINFKDYGINNIKDYVMHEALTFNKNENFVVEKYHQYIYAFDKILFELKKDFNINNNIKVFQELGGFVANLSLYFCSRKHNISHYFFEPSLFDGMLFLIKNNYLSIKNLDGVANKNDINVRKLLDLFSSTQPSVIPDKDKHLFKQNIFLKVFNFKNFYKFLLKMFNKYILFQKEEFNHIFNHVLRNFKSIINSLKLKFYYDKKIKLGKRNLYFPLHVPYDIQLTIRSPKNINQLKLTSEILKIAVKRDFKLFIKEHPAMIGSYDSSTIKKLLIKYPDNFAILHPSMNTYDIIDKMDAIITINSKVGAEALSQFKKVFVLGDAFYSSSNVLNFDSVFSLNEFLINSDFQFSFNDKDKENINSFFKKVYKSSYPMQLYLHNDKNINIFAKSLLSLD